MTKDTFLSFRFESSDGDDVSAVPFRNPDGTMGGWVATNAEVGTGVYIEKGAIIGPGARILEGTRVKQGTIVEPNTVFGV